METKIDEMGLRLKTFLHHHLKGDERYRFRTRLQSRLFPISQKCRRATTLANGSHSDQRLARVSLHQVVGQRENQ